MASLPLKIYTRANGSSPPIRYYGPSLFDQPSATSNIFDWIYQCMTSLVLHGNAWGLITGRDGYGYPTGIEWVPPDRVQVEDDPQQPWNPLRTRVYLYGRQMPDWRNDMLHIRAFTIPGRTEGISPLRAFAMTLMSGMEAQRYGNDWFAAGGFPPGTFQNNELEIDAEAAAEIRESLTTAIRNHQPLVYGRDWDYKPVVVPPSEAQFLEAVQMNATQIAAVYGLPPDRVGGARGDSLTYNTVEQSTLQVIEALRPWMVRLETAFFNLLPQSRYVRFNADALLKTDLQTRTNIYNVQRDMGLRTNDELRELEDLAPLPNGVGNEALGQELIEQLVRAGAVPAIPKSLLPALTLNQDIVVPLLEKLQNEGLTQPLTQPSAPSPAKYADNLVSQGVGRNLNPDDVNEILRELVQEHRRKREAAGGPEFVGPWVPSEKDLARIAAADGNGNGNGRHH